MKNSKLLAINNLINSKEIMSVYKPSSKNAVYKQSVELIKSL